MPSQPNRLLISSSHSSTPRPLPLAGRAMPKALRPRKWAVLSNDEILSRFVPGKVSLHTLESRGGFKKAPDSANRASSARRRTTGWNWPSTSAAASTSMTRAGRRRAWISMA